MKTTLLALLLGTALLAVGIACSDDASLEDYIFELEALGKEPDRKPSLFEEFNVQAGIPITENEAYMNAAATEVVGGITRFERLDPPNRLKDAHETLLAVANQELELFAEPHPTLPNNLTLRSFDALCEIYAVADEEGIEHDFDVGLYCDPDDPSRARRRTPTP